MTNVPTLGFIVVYVMILAVIPFIMGVIPAQFLFKNTKTSIIAGIGSLFFYIVLMKLSFSFLVTSLIAAFVSCILIGIALYSIKKWDIPVIDLNITEKLSFINRKTINVLIVVAILFFVVLSYGQSQEKEMEFSVIDPMYDVEYQGMTGTELREYEYIDITRLDSKIVGDTVVLEMELAGNVSEKDTVDYNFFVFISRYSAPSETISKWEMEKDGKILRGYVPLEIAENGQIFYVQATASESDFNSSMGIDGIYDSCSKKKALGGAVESFDAFVRMVLTWLLD